MQANVRNMWTTSMRGRDAISMGCGVACPMHPIDQDWGLEDPVEGIEMFRTIRDRMVSSP